MSKKRSISVFFDTEFTSLIKGENQFLISIALVSQDGREIYRELSDVWQPHHCSQFVLDNVLPLLQFDEHMKPEAQVAKDLQAFIESLSDDPEVEIILRSDCSIDWPHIEYLFQFFGCWPKNLRRKWGPISFDNHNFQHRYEAGLKFYWKETGEDKRHHALHDARSLRFAWKYTILRGM